MTVWRVIPAGDAELGPVKANGKRSITLITGPRYVRQKIAARLNFFLDEWFLDRRLGVPYYRDVFLQNPDLDITRAVFRSVILSVPEVAGVDKLTLGYNPLARSLAVEFDAPLVAGGILRVRQPDVPFIIRVQRKA